MHPHPAIFQPLQLRHLALRNRINFGAHTANMSVDGLPGDRHLGYYRERAMGGAAMIVVEPIPIHRTAVLTRGKRGSLIIAGDEFHVIDAHPVETLVDTTGAGDLYAAGVLYGLSQRLELAHCGRLGSLAASEVISHVGARPQTPLVELAGRLPR